MKYWSSDVSILLLLFGMLARSGDNGDAALYTGDDARHIRTDSWR